MDVNDPKFKKLQKIDNLIEMRNRIREMQQQLSIEMEQVSSEMRSRALIVDLELDEFESLEQSMDDCFNKAKSKIEDALVNIH